MEEDSHINWAQVSQAYEIRIYYFLNSEESPIKKREPGMVRILNRYNHVETFVNVSKTCCYGTDFSKWSHDIAREGGKFGRDWKCAEWIRG